MAKTAQAIPKGYHTVTPSLFVAGAARRSTSTRRRWEPKSGCAFRPPTGPSCTPRSRSATRLSCWAMRCRTRAGRARRPSAAPRSASSCTARTWDAAWKQAIDAGGKEVMPLEDQSGVTGRAGRFVDPFGTSGGGPAYREMTPEELTRREKRSSRRRTDRIDPPERNRKNGADLVIGSRSFVSSPPPTARHNSRPTRPDRPEYVAELLRTGSVGTRMILGLAPAMVPLHQRSEPDSGHSSHADRSSADWPTASARRRSGSRFVAGVKLRSRSMQPWTAGQGSSFRVQVPSPSRCSRRSIGSRPRQPHTWPSVVIQSPSA